MMPAWTAFRGVLRTTAHVGLILTLLGTVLTVYEGTAPAEWWRPSRFWSVARPVVSDVVVLERAPMPSREDMYLDRIILRVSGSESPPSYRSDQYALVAFVRLSSDPSAVWSLGLDETGIKMATIEGDRLEHGNWDLVLSGLTCPHGYRGSIQVVTALIPAEEVDSLQPELGGSTLLPVDGVPVTATAIVANSATVFSDGLTAGVVESPYRQVAALTTNVSIERFRASLGQESYQQTRGDFREYVFEAEAFYVYALADRDETVLLFCVTTRRSDFRPEFVYWSGTRYELVTLGENTFAEFAAPDQIGGFFGANRAAYYEFHYFGNPGNYLHYILASNDSSFMTPWDGVTGAVSLEGMSAALDDPRANESTLAEYRTQTLVNTYGEMSPDFSPEMLRSDVVGGDFYGGVNLQDVRVHELDTLASVFAARMGCTLWETTLIDINVHPDLKKPDRRTDDGSTVNMEWDFADGSMLHLTFERGPRLWPRPTGEAEGQVLVDVQVSAPQR